MTNNDVIDDLVSIYIQQDSLAEQAKELVAEAKKAGLDHKTLVAIAKAKAKDKLEDLKERTDALQVVLNQV